MRYGFAEERVKIDAFCRVVEDADPYGAPFKTVRRAGTCAPPSVWWKMRRDVGIAPYKVHSDSPEIGVH